MALLLNIDSAFEKCFVALSSNEEVIAQELSLVQKDHAAFLQPAIKKICDTTGIKLSSVDAIAVANGPGSYTGLRVGLSSAKGICYALQKPLILLNTLDVLAFALHQECTEKNNILICPLIDARRMEVFTALYDYHLKLINNYRSVILDEFFLNEERQNNLIAAGGNGSKKLQTILPSANFLFGTLYYSTQHFVKCSNRIFTEKKFAQLSYTEPFYLKPVYMQ